MALPGAAGAAGNALPVPMTDALSPITSHRTPGRQRGRREHTRQPRPAPARHRCFRLRLYPGTCPRTPPQVFGTSIIRVCAMNRHARAPVDREDCRMPLRDGTENVGRIPCRSRWRVSIAIAAIATLAVASPLRAQETGTVRGLRDAGGERRTGRRRGHSAPRKRVRSRSPKTGRSSSRTSRPARTSSLPSASVSPPPPGRSPSSLAKRPPSTSS